MIEFSKLKGNNVLAKNLSTKIMYMFMKIVERTLIINGKSKCRRSFTAHVDFKTQCPFCARNVATDKKQFHLAQTSQINKTVLNECKIRIKKNQLDTWAIEVN